MNSADSFRPGTRDATVDPAALAALRPHLINLWGGRFSQEGLFHTDEGDVDRIFNDNLPRRLASLADGQLLPIVLYAHGGLVGEAAGLRIAANQIPWWKANGCYPLQFVWETGLFESLEKIVGIQRALSRALSDVTDGAVEFAAHTLGGPQIWGNMKNSAAAAFEPGAPGSLIAQRLVAFARANPEQVRLHAVGHSAGSIFHAHLLWRLDALDAPALETISFLAPAITVDEYRRLIDPLVPKRAKKLRIFTMSKDYELRDTVTPLYRKSLLYLIRNALEPRIGEPVLGLEESLRGSPDLVERFGLGTHPSGTGKVVWSVTAAATGAEASRSASHGGFDNDVPTMNSVARDILGIADTTPLTSSFPTDTEQRAAFMPSTSVSLGTEEPVPPPAVAPPLSRVDGPSARRALCVGINAYPAPNTLEGCVADAEAWGAALEKLGFAVDKLQDLAASHVNVIGRLRAMVEGSRAGDVLVFQYAGHGTQVPDLDGDEATDDGHPGNDQAICPVDFESGSLIIDDDIRAVLDRLPQGVQLTCFMDNCHSATATRFLVGRETAKPNARSRYVQLSQEVVDRFVRKRTSVNRARDLVGGRVAAGTREEMRWVSFAACRDSESAWESDGHGDFTRLAVPLLHVDEGVTNRVFQDLVLTAFGPNRRQTPKLDCRDQDTSARFLIGSSERHAAAAPNGPAASCMGPETIKQETKAATAAEVPSGGNRARDIADLLAAIARVMQ